MERDRLLEHLSSAKRHVDESENQIAAQKRIISYLMTAGKNTTDADTVLRMFELSQSSLIMEVEMILDVLDKLPLIEDDARS